VSQSTPTAVVDYLADLKLLGSHHAYIALDQRNQITDLGGDLSRFDLDALVSGQLASTQLSFLEGLLPGDDKPVVIPNTQFLQDLFVDLHLFTTDANQWVVFVDNTEAGRNLQQDQQQRLEQDIKQEAAKR